jgi:hypothetical protein
MDKLVAKIPGSTSTKAFVTALVCVAGCAIPAFGTSAPERQGHALFSHEKPEQIASGQERQRRQERQNRGSSEP